MECILCNVFMYLRHCQFWIGNWFEVPVANENFWKAWLILTRRGHMSLLTIIIKYINGMECCRYNWKSAKQYKNLRTKKTFNARLDLKNNWTNN